MKELGNRISSREVAEMMEVEHKHLLRKVDKINKDFTESKIGPSKYWVESCYKDSSGKTNREYLITKRGCEFLAHKTTGTKGNLFTDKYMDRFEQMKEAYLKANTLAGSNAYRNEIETVKCEIGLIDMVSNTLKLNDNSKLKLITKSFENHNINTNLLPAYSPSKGVLKCATELLKEHNSKLSVIKFNKKLVELGILKECTRQSTKDKNKVKKFKNLIDTTWGENQINPKNSKETQPLYYENKFNELLKIVQA